MLRSGRKTIRSSLINCRRNYSDGAKYTSTLQLPETTLPMRANATKSEPLLRETCCDKLYQWQAERYKKNPNKYPLWVTHDGPPYANGPPHIGHSLNKILKDFVNRYKLLSGHSISYIPGFKKFYSKKIENI